MQLIHVRALQIPELLTYHRRLAELRHDPHMGESSVFQIESTPSSLLMSSALEARNVIITRAQTDCLGEISRSCNNDAPSANIHHRPRPITQSPHSAYPPPAAPASTTSICKVQGRSYPLRSNNLHITGSVTGCYVKLRPLHSSVCRLFRWAGDTDVAVQYARIHYRRIK